MGIYLVSADVEEWFGGAVAAALDEELARRGLPPQLPPAASAAPFEEKVMPPMGTFGALCREVLAPEEAAGLLDWTELVPVPFDGVIELPVPSTYGDRTVVFSAHRLLPLAERLAAVLELPEDLRRSGARTMEVSSWFLDATGNRTRSPVGRGAGRGICPPPSTPRRTCGRPSTACDRAAR
ncbi:hypothetical protein [Kitasatospora griseola]|uniref:hypothetical protein n=1 Tax=Kitasatospora griseola TaxID=2064 RepID=UPI0034248542